MVIAMFLAHLVGDYVLQWDELAAWKAREMKGVIVHSDLRDYDVMAWDFCLNFAKDNELQVSETRPQSPA